MNHEYSIYLGTTPCVSRRDILLYSTYHESITDKGQCHVYGALRYPRSRVKCAEEGYWGIRHVHVIRECLHYVIDLYY